MNYSEKLLGWMDENHIHDDSLRNYFKSAESDDAKEVMANMYRNFLMQKPKESHQAPGGEHAHDDEYMLLEPYENADGSFGYIDRVKGRVIVSVTKHSNGLFSYAGPRKYLEILGGRGSLSGIVDRMADGKYFNKN